MIQTVFNSMITIMLAKFMLNDVPHAFRFVEADSPSWMPRAWEELVLNMKAHGVDLDARMSEATTEDQLGTNDVSKYKMLLSGYYLIAAERANDVVVNDLYSFLRAGVAWGKQHAYEGIGEKGMSFDEALRFLRREQGLPEEGEPVLYKVDDRGYLAIVESIAFVDRLFVDGGRANKIIAIDSTMSVIHATEGILQYVTPLRWGQGIAFVFVDVLDILQVGEAT